MPAWSLSEAVYASKFLSVASQAINGLGLELSDDGTKAYVADNTTDTIYQYTLSTPWDISSGTYASKSKAVGDEDISPGSIRIGSSGTKLYVSGGANDRIYQYTLGTAWDISTASYDSVSFDCASETTTANGMAFGDAGSKMYLTKQFNGTVYQYTLSTPWDLSTASYASKSVSVNSQEGRPNGLFFKTDGTKMFVVGDYGTADTTYYVYQYTLSTPWDVSTATYDSVSFNLSSQGTGPQDIFIGNSGGTMYTVDISQDKIFQYTLGDPEPSTTVPSAVTDLALTVLSPNAIRLDWTAPDDGGEAITGYLIEIDEGEGFATLVADTGTDAVTYTASGLTAATEYGFRVSAINSVGTATASNEEYETTDADVPAEVDDLEVEASGPYSATLTWSEPAANGDPVVGYQIERESPTSSGFEVIVADTGDTETSYVDTGLQSGTSYNYRVSGINSEGVGQSIFEANVETDPAPSLGIETGDGSTLVASGLLAVNTPRASKSELHTIEFGAGEDVEATVPTGLSVILGMSAIRADADCETDNSDALFIDNAVDDDSGFVVLSSGTVTISRMKTDAAATLGAAVWLVELEGY